MQIRRSLTTARGVITAALEVRLETLETAYAAAYGEPKIDRAGLFTFRPEHTSVPQLELSAFAELGAPPEAGLVSSVTGLPQRSYALQASGALALDGLTNQGAFAYAPEVIGDFDFVLCFSASTVAGVQSLVGIGVFQEAGASAAGLLFGWGHLETPRVSLRQRGTTGAALTEIAGADLASPTGLTIRLVRSGNTLTAYWSVDLNSTWQTLGTATITQQALRVGLFANSGSAALASTVFQGLSLSNVLSSTATSFRIAGSPDLHLIRTESPHQLSLDLSLDAEARAKASAWADEIQDRLAAAKAALMALPNPTTTDTVILEGV